MAKYNTKWIGSTAEKLACDYLTKQGLHLVCSNYATKHGEIDLILQDQDDIVFVEVRIRSNEDYGTALESITKAKIQKIISAARYYLQVNQCLYTVVSRFDVVVLHPTEDVMEIEWIKSAFTYDTW